MTDADAVAELFAARARADFGEETADFTGETLREWWALAPERLADSSWVVVEDGRALAFARAFADGERAELVDDTCVHPEARGRGIGTQLLELGEAWARERGLGRIIAAAVEDSGRRLLEGRGYGLVRHYWRMERDLAGPIERAPAPDGVEIRPYRAGEEERAVYDLVQESFKDHWEFVPDELERWLHFRLKRSDYVPELWLVADDGERLVGASLTFAEHPLGWVLELGVRREHRGRGLGLALLTHSFAGLAERGIPRAGLEVDAANETGATRLYERAGMRVTRRYDWYGRQL